MPKLSKDDLVYFDKDWYVKAYPDVKLSGLDPLTHFKTIGIKLGRSPCKSMAADVLSDEQQKAILAAAYAYGGGRGTGGRKADGSSIHVGGNLGSLRGYIAESIDKLYAERPTPYYKKLLEVSKKVDNPAVLQEMKRMLDTCDLQRYGQIPRSGRQKVSVIVPVWNRQDLIKDALNSVLTQTHQNLEILVCDDASEDNTRAVIERLKDPRIRLLKNPKRKGAAVARNVCLEQVTGDIVAYLDSDNLWHPRYLELMLEQAQEWPGCVSYYASFFDITLNDDRPWSGKVNLSSFHLEDQIEKPYVDLNSFVHQRALLNVFGNFDEKLERRQDYDLISRYCWIREPKHLNLALNLYQRIDGIDQITKVKRNDSHAINRIDKKISGYYSEGVPARFPEWVKKVTVLSWDMSRNHFAKAYSVAEALSKDFEVELISFRFFEVPVFQPLADIEPPFTVKYFEGAEFPRFFDDMARAVQSIEGDIIYCVKPRLSSLGVALLSNYHTGKPIFLEANDLETVVSSPKDTDRHLEIPLEDVLERFEEAKSPYGNVWSQALEKCVSGIPTLYTHNINLNIHYGKRALYMRNIKNQKVFDPQSIDRDKVRKELGYGPEDRVIFFGGLVRKHKGIFELVNLLEKLDDSRYKLLVVGSRETPDLKKLSATADNLQILPPQPPERMAALNGAADMVILWLDPSVAAGHYQSPYKMSDALAMGPAIIASPISDQASFSEKELMWSVPFGDYERLVQTINSIFSDEQEKERRRKRARQFFLREFSYNAVPAAFALGCASLDSKNRIYPISEHFAKFFARFEARFEEES